MAGQVFLMVALCDFDFEGATFARGELLRVSPLYAAVLNYQQKARFQDDIAQISGTDPSAAPMARKVIEPAQILLMKQVTHRRTRTVTH